ncbi:hypothetical protein F5Y17DRAFT_416222 [Xylariaceae sp. FL0594]|nr:hypothetical protein F5Y17DRAFT_416222 [Xylariaceae sp. FL0594]
MPSSSRLGFWEKSAHSRCFDGYFASDLSGYGYINEDHPEKLQTIFNYNDPFNAECRAYGRLREAGCEELAVRSFGYVLLDEDHECALMSLPNVDRWTFNGTANNGSDSDEGNEQRLFYPGKGGRPPPFRCIVKAFGSPLNPSEDGGNLTPSAARQYLRNITKIRKLGIINIDVRIEQLINGKHGDFSTAYTLPHPMFSPELNLQLSPNQVRELEKHTFLNSTNDFAAFDQMIRQWNNADRFNPETYGCNSGIAYPALSIEAFPGAHGCLGKSLEPRYNLRNRNRNRAHESLYTLVDPRKYRRWIKNRVVRSANASPASPRSVGNRGLQGGKNEPTGRPELWYDQSDTEDRDWVKLVGPRTSAVWDTLSWDSRDGSLFPMKYKMFRRAVTVTV